MINFYHNYYEFTIKSQRSKETFDKLDKLLDKYANSEILDYYGSSNELVKLLKSEANNQDYYLISSNDSINLDKPLSDIFLLFNEYNYNFNNYDDSIDEKNTEELLKYM